MGALENLKDAVKLAQQLGSIELQQKLIEAQQASLELQEENGKLRKRVSELEDATATRASLEFRDDVYWRVGGVGEEGPFCSVCFDVRGKLVRLHTRGQYWSCLNCEKSVLRPGQTPQGGTTIVRG